MSGKRKKIEKWDLIKIKNIYSSKDVINIIFLDSIYMHFYCCYCQVTSVVSNSV